MSNEQMVMGPPPDPTPTPKKNLFWILILLVVVVGSVIFILNKNQSNTTQGESSPASTTASVKPEESSPASTTASVKPEESSPASTTASVKPEESSPASTTASVKPEETTTNIHIVKKGDYLWEISNRIYKTPYKWSIIYDANKDKIKNPNIIYPNQKLIIPN